MNEARVMAVVGQYKSVLEARGNQPVRESEKPRTEDPREQKLDHVLWMTNVLIKRPEYSDDKRNRWLGWIQGVLWSEGIFNLEEEKQHNVRTSGLSR